VHVQSCDVKENEGLFEAIDWVLEHLDQSKFSDLISHVQAVGCVTQ